MLSISALSWLTVAENQARVSELWSVADVVLGAGAYVLVFFRRRWPLPVAVTTALVGAVSGVAAGPAVLAAVSLATHRRWRQLAVVGSLNFAGAQLFGTLTASDEDPAWVILVANAVATAGILGWGMYIGSRRELIWTLRSRAERAEAEQELRVAQARSNEQARIAREMHDVLAHRISQISMHAGALAFRDDLTADEMRSSAAVIQEKAHEALTDLRGVLGVLRDDATGERLRAPQPTYADLRSLVDEASASGLRVDLQDLVRGDPPEAVGRTVYRIVQEGLTNARKHAPGALVTVQVSGSAEDGVDVLLRNPLGFGTSSTPGAGLGLVGLTERAELRGGRLEAGRDGSTFVLHGWIPWAA
ncbi:MAG: histidine kinase [Nocardioides sp.]|nr:histidine kinase [Nocardioides sp.]